MLEKLKEFMSSTFDYEVTEYAIHETEYKKSILIPIALALFGLVFIFYIVDLAAGLGILNFIVVLFLFVVLVIAPFALRKENKYLALAVTPQYLVQRTSRTQFIAIDYDEIEAFKVTESGIIISDKEKSIVLGVGLLREEIDPIIDILEAKGKTFDPEKDYMIRPIEIKIKDNKVQIIDLVVTTALDELYDEIVPGYTMLTPGYIEEINFRNVNIISGSVLGDKNLQMKIDQFEVKDGHPENTKFESIIAMDGVLVFHNAVVRQLFIQDHHDDEVKDKKLDNNLALLPPYLANAVITSWKIGKKSIDFYIATGVYTLKLILAYENVLIGWNKSK